MTVDIPPLRERREDIPLLFQHFVLVAGVRDEREPPPPATDQLHHLMQADWPGNVRELRNAAERYVLLGESLTYDLDRLLGAESGSPAMTLPEQVECFERSLIEQHLKAHGSASRTRWLRWACRERPCTTR